MAEFRLNARVRRVLTPATKKNNFPTYVLEYENPLDYVAFEAKRNWLLDRVIDLLMDSSWCAEIQVPFSNFKVGDRLKIIVQKNEGGELR